MNLQMYVEFVAPLIISRKYGVSIEDAEEIIWNSLTDEAKKELNYGR